MITSLPLATPSPVAPLRGLAPYAPPPRRAHIDLRLDANERTRSPRDFTALLGSLSPDDLCRYPCATPLEALIASRLGIDAERVLVTAGGDEAIDRTMRAYLSESAQLLTVTPTFEMISRSARLTGAAVTEIPWVSGSFPVSNLVTAIDDSTALIAVVSPNNPTGTVATAEDLCAISRAAPDTILLIDLAYTEYADLDLTHAALDLPNTIVIRTLSKAWGLAGLRIGYAIASPEIIHILRAAGGPYTASAASLAIAQRALTAPEMNPKDHISTTRRIRATLRANIEPFCIACPPSQGNFLLPQFRDAAWTADALASLGIAVRRYSTPELKNCLRITCPESNQVALRLSRAIEAANAPRALLFDMDDVIADVSCSYREAIIQTGATYAVALTTADIATANSEGDANNNWILTQRLLAARGVNVPLSEITACFESIYQGTPSRPGLYETETLIPQSDTLLAIAARLPLAIVTGRPRADCDRFLERFRIADLFPIRICMEDAAAKPNPEPVLLALEALNTDSAWLIGDTLDDVLAARRAGVIPVGFTSSSLAMPPVALGSTARTLADLSELLDLLP